MPICFPCMVGRHDGCRGGTCACLHASHTRCPDTWPDDTTPSGRTQCIEDIGHMGTHRHINQNRAITWERNPQMAERSGGEE